MVFDDIFGVWAERKISVNVFGKYYDSLMSMAKALDIPYSSAYNMVDIDMEKSIIDYMIRYINKTKCGLVVQRVDNQHLLYIDSIEYLRGISLCISDTDIISLYKRIKIREAIRK